MKSYSSWGNYPKDQQDASIQKRRWADEPLPADTSSLLPYGNGRSYGDSCLNKNGTLLDMRGLDRILSFDARTGILRCEAGVLLANILPFVVPMGWFPAVTPGTCFVTIGGAIANDVHGKNHHRTGSFGQHVLRFALQRSDCGVIVCSKAENSDYFEATIGGLGLTGVILWAEIQLKPVANAAMLVETIRFANLDEFFLLSSQSDKDYEYTVAWIDCLAQKQRLGRGVFMRANHAPPLENIPKAPGKKPAIAIEPPFSFINGLSLRAFNSLYYHRQIGKTKISHVHYKPFFYPLDGLKNWNRLYGRAGFLQYQCVIPPASAKEGIKSILSTIAAAKKGSFLAVLKMFGNQAAPGMLSFPRPGTTLALDFPNQGQSTLDFLNRLDEIVGEAGGAVYPAKDARLSRARFEQYFPRWALFENYIDPRFSSSFWRRVAGENKCVIS